LNLLSVAYINAFGKIYIDSLHRLVAKQGKETTCKEVIEHKIFSSYFYIHSICCLKHTFELPANSFFKFARSSSTDELSSIANCKNKQFSPIIMQNCKQ
jgi:hypothetical protein